MTEHEHAEISRRLALAIGWDSEDVQMVMAFQGHPAYCEVWPWGKACGGNWKPFDYRNPYQARHTFASSQLTAGANPWYIASQLGHVDVQMVFKIYGKFIAQDFQKPTPKLRIVGD